MAENGESKTPEGCPLRDIRNQEPCRFSRRLRDFFGGQIAAAYGAFHGGRPAGPRPISRQRHVWRTRLRRRAKRFGLGRGGKRGALLLDHVRFEERGLLDAWEVKAQISNGDLHDFIARKS